jgi:hypothetical protein
MTRSMTRTMTRTMTRRHLAAVERVSHESHAAARQVAHVAD